MIAAMPSYNEGQVIAEVILDYKKCTDKTVVDDESSENTLEIDEFI
jgi:glycosyltransferase involved in cell wall biosynthesis